MLSQNGSGRNTALAWCSVGFGTFYLGVRKWMERTPIAGSKLASLSDIQLSIAIVFLTLAVPLAVHGHWVTVGWMAEGAVLVWVATRVRTSLMQYLAAAALALGLISLAMDATVAQTHVFWNTRFLSFAVSVAAMAIATMLARGEADREGATKSGERWELLAQTGAVIAHALVIIAVLLEIHTWWWSGPPPAARVEDLRSPGSLLSSAIWLMAASGAMIWAAMRGKPAVRKFMVQHTTAQLIEAIFWALGGLIALCIGMVYPQQQVIWNLRFVAFALAVAAMMWVARQSQEGSPRRGSQVHIGASVLATVLALTAICFEISTFWSTRPLLAAPGSVMYASQVAGRQMAERFSYSAWFLLAGAALLVFGFRRQSALLRWQALVLLAVTICKVFLLDTSTLSQGYRIVSFLALGALLLAVSFAYQRDWLHLRAASAANDGETK
jgi:peptidoglycan/LPS O-acetylase OafA/YrhL